jgi:uncharacterized protein
MRLSLRIFTATALFSLALPALALNSNVGDAGLPSASDYSTSVLPELQGVVSWKTLAQVEPVKQGATMGLQFSKAILALDKKVVQVQGFMMPLDMGDKQRHFLVSAVPPSCPFCMPAGPEAIVEVLSKKPIAYGYEPVIVSGRLALLQGDPAGMLYRMTDAEMVETKVKLKESP